MRLELFEFQFRALNRRIDSIRGHNYINVSLGTHRGQFSPNYALVIISIAP